MQGSFHFFIGFMLAQCTAAALVSENKVLTHPSSVDSLSTSAGTEDHVSMGGFAARKALTVVEHVEYGKWDTKSDTLTMEHNFIFYRKYYWVK